VPVDLLGVITLSTLIQNRAARDLLGLPPSLGLIFMVTAASILIFGIATLCVLIMSAKRAKQLGQLPSSIPLLILYVLGILFTTIQTLAIPVLYALGPGIRILWQ
jgi:hypothetical protein